MPALRVPLRPMRWWDLEGVTALERELFGPTAWSAETFWSELAAPGRAYLVAEEAEDAGLLGCAELLGYAGLAAGGGEADVQTVAVAPGAQGRGVGRALLDALVAEAGRRGAPAVLLEVRADNAPARALYASSGFERIGVRRRYYQPGDVDALVMRRRLR